MQTLDELPLMVRAACCPTCRLLVPLPDGDGGAGTCPACGRNLANPPDAEPGSPD